MKTIVFLTLLTAVAVSPAMAEQIKGEVLSVSPNYSAITLGQENASQPDKKEIQVLIDKNTKLNGLSNLTELMKGDEVVVDVKKSKEGLKAKSVTIDKVKLHEKAPK